METTPQSSASQKDVLILTCVHGDEQFANDPVYQLQKDYGDRFDWIIGNPQAMQKNVRYIEVDLNRVAPGDPKGKEYEVRRAAELCEILQQYHFVLDIHGTIAHCGIFTLIPNPSIHTLALAAALPIENIVIWARQERKETKRGSLCYAHPCAVGIECGPKNAPEISEKLLAILRSIVRDGIQIQIASRLQKRIFRVYGSLPDQADLPQLKDFQETQFNGETFYPLLAAQYKGIACYKMQEVDLWEHFAY